MVMRAHLKVVTILKLISHRPFHLSSLEWTSDKRNEWMVLAKSSPNLLIKLSL